MVLIFDKLANSTKMFPNNIAYLYIFQILMNVLITHALKKVQLVASTQ